jgi:hypothetical protein
LLCALPARAFAWYTEIQSLANSSLMRLALVAASAYQENGQVEPIPNAELDVELFGGRLAEADADFQVHAFAAQRGLAEGVEQLVRSLGERPAALVFYFWGYALQSAERGPTLLLDGAKLTSFTLNRLRRQLSELADVSLVILDATLAEGSVGEPLDAVRAFGAALSGGDSNVSSLIAVRPAQHRVPPGPPPFTGLLQMILDAQTGSAVDLTPETLFRTMQSEEVMFADIPAAGCFLGQREFVLVSGVAPLSVAPPSIAPPSIAPAARAYSAPPESTEEVTAPRAQRVRVPPPPPPPPLPRPAELARSAPPAVPVAAPAAPAAAVAAPAAAVAAPAAAVAAPAVLAEPPGEPVSSAAEHCRRVLADCERAGDRDGAYRAAQCLEVLGEADINESLLATTHRPEGLQAVRASLSYADWHERLCAGCDEPRTTAVLRALGPALARVGYQHARRLRREVSLPDDARQDPEKSTTTLAKTLHWTSRLLCVPAAQLYVLPEVSGSVALAPGAEQPLLTCGRALGSGFALPELVGLWARELSFARQEQAALCYFPDVSELSHLLRAAFAVSGVVGMGSIDGDAKRLASGLKREVRGPQLDALRAAVQAFPMHEVDARALAFIRSAELVARRVALVACGDLELTLALDRRFPRAGLTELAERRADLLRFTLSTELGAVRAALGVALRS